MATNAAGFLTKDGEFHVLTTVNFVHSQLDGDSVARNFTSVYLWFKNYATNPEQMDPISFTTTLTFRL